MQTGSTEFDIITIVIIGVLMLIGFILGLIPIVGAVYAIIVAIVFFLTGGDEIGIILIAGSVWIGAFLSAIVTFVFGGALWQTPNLFVSTILIMIYMFMFLLSFFGGIDILGMAISLAASGALGMGMAVAVIKGPSWNENIGCKCITVKGKSFCAGNLNACEK